MSSSAKLIVAVAIALVLALAGSALVGFLHGVSVTAARWEADVATIQKKYADRETDRALALAAVLEEANMRQAAAMSRTAALERKLLEADAVLARERRAQNKRIADAVQTARNDCAGLSAEWVRLYNDFTAPNPHFGPGDGGTASADAAAAAGAPGAAAPGVSPGQPGLTSPADLLGHARDYGEYCRSLEIRARGWATYYEAR
jgi:hypothetical protein